jgi:hypothetical protein
MPVFGTILFKDDSSVCRAAIHNGVIKADEGGMVEVAVEDGRNNYAGSTSNGITSESFTSPWDRSFVVNKAHLRCPKDNFKSYNAPGFASFLETDSNFDFAKLAKTGETATKTAKTNVKAKNATETGKTTEKAVNMSSEANGTSEVTEKSTKPAKDDSEVFSATDDTGEGAEDTDFDEDMKVKNT